MTKLPEHLLSLKVRVILDMLHALRPVAVWCDHATVGQTRNAARDRLNT